jgi:putative transposase
MRHRRIKGEGTSFYHCMSRVVDGRFLFNTQGTNSVEAEYFVELMRRLEKACCVQVLTYAVMSNHFHILCRVREQRMLSDAELLDCIEAGYGPERRKEVAERLALYQQNKCSSDPARELKETYSRRLFDISVFMKELKGRFAQWYNRRHQRYGVLWAERFKSVLIEDGSALRAVAAYIDLNPLRAGLCEDPKDYRYCGYAEAVAQNIASTRLGLRLALGFSPEESWNEVSQEYRKLLFLTGTSAAKIAATIDIEIARKVTEEQQGKIPLGGLLRCRIRYFTDGGILGSRAFVQEQFARFKRLTESAPPNSGHPLAEFAGQKIWVLRHRRGHDNTNAHFQYPFIP